MATKHFFHDTSGVVNLGLQALVSRNSHLALDAPNKVIYLKDHSPSKVSFISGGGSGHEPAWSGYVGDGMLAASVSGEVFASPSTKQIVAAIEHVASDAGTILCITNYTGDSLHFGLAREKALGAGYKVGFLKMTDDVGLGRKQTENLGRRGLAGNMFVLKLCGAASQADWTFEQCHQLGQSVNDNCVTIGSSLDYCHTPGRTHYEALPPDTYSVAQGIHNEAGLKQISPIPPAKDLVKSLLPYLLSPDDPDRSFVSFSPSDTVLVLINNFGGISNFELEALTQTTMSLLESDWSIRTTRVLVSCFESSLNAPGFSISLLNVSGINRETGVSEEQILAFLDEPTTAPAWPRNDYRADSSSAEQNGSRKSKISTSTNANFGPKVDAKVMENMLRTACDRTIAAEPDITKWDTQMGDGDCGESCEIICKQILVRLDDGLCEKHNGALFPVLDEVEECVEEVGGTLGAILAIFVAGFASTLKALYKNNDSKADFGAEQAAQAVQDALKSLQSYTGARVGGRTVMDTLIPFCNTFASSKTFDEAVSAAEKGAKSTEGMNAKFGRASYLADKVEGEAAVPMDPGAWAAAVFLKGLREGLGN